MNDTEIEKWVTLKQGGLTYNNYLISSLGRVFNKKTGKFGSHVITGKPAYFYINLITDDGERKLRRVHNIMGWSFLGRPPTKKHTVDHEDRNKYNNALYNLRWLDKIGQSMNRDMCSEDSSVNQEFLLEKYEYGTPIHKYLYRKMSYEGMSYEDACFCWVENIKPTYKIRNSSFCMSLEIDGTWYPNKTYCSKVNNISLEKLNKGLKLDLSLKDMKTLLDNKEKFRFFMDGYWMTRGEHCERLCISLERVSAYMSKQGITFEDAVKIPIQRVTKHWVNGVIYNNKDLFVKYDLKCRSANSELSKCKSIRETLEHYNVDTSDLEIYPCDGSDVIMINNPL